MTDTPRARIALFDLDHTLLPIDSDYAWGEFTLDIGWTDREHFRKRNDEFYATYQAGTLDIHEYVRFATEAFRARGPDAAHAAREQFLRDVIRPVIRAEAVELVDSHRRAGDVLVVVTATNEFVTEPIARLFGIDELIAVRLARDASGWYTGEIDGIPSLRDGKVARVQEWLAARGWTWRDVDTTFYSDSRNDLPLLARVDRPVATNPDDTLRAAARNQGWRILDLFGQK